MTPEEFKTEIRKDQSQWSKLWEADLDSMIATVREQARREALEEAAKEVDSWYGSPTECAKAIRNKANPRRTLDDVLADIEARLVGTPELIRLKDIARTAVEGLVQMCVSNPAETRLAFLRETIRKLTEIK